MSFQHGGQLERIKKAYAHQSLPWVDLSTGISPFSYPVDDNIETCLQNLPQQYTQMTQAACDYYGTDDALLIPGSMWAIQTLPLIRSQLLNDDARPVLIPKQGFNEHIKAWQSWGFNIEYYDDAPTDEQLSRAQVCVVINPNNPTGYTFEKTSLQRMHKTLLAQSAWLIVDEAFLDLTPEISMSGVKDKGGLIVLKSFGKYFGLPGLRVGALISPPDITQYAQRFLNEWTINSAAQKIASRAWLDKSWQLTATQNIKASSERLCTLLSRLGFVTNGTYFFQTLVVEQASELYEYLLQQGIYVRLLDDESGIRIGLPKYDEHWQRLEKALCECTVINVKTNLKPI